MTRTIQIGTATLVQGYLLNQSNGYATVSVYGRTYTGRLLPEYWR